MPHTVYKSRAILLMGKFFVTVQPCARVYDKERYKLACKSDLAYILAHGWTVTIIWNIRNC